MNKKDPAIAPTAVLDGRSEAADEVRDDATDGPGEEPTFDTS